MKFGGALMQGDARRIAQVFEHRGRAGIPRAGLTLDGVQYDLLELGVQVRPVMVRRLRVGRSRAMTRLSTGAGFACRSSRPAQRIAVRSPTCLAVRK